jgi:hypothetical protein
VLALAGFAALIVGGVAAATLAAGSILRSRLELIAKDANLQLKLEDVSVSPFGRLQVRGLSFERRDATAVLAVREASAELSPWKLLLGRRRPQRAEVKQFNLDVLLQDGQPKELLELYKAARKQLPSRSKKDEQEDKKPKSSTALFIDQGEIKVRVQGKGSQYLPQGLRIHDVALHVDLSHGIGDLTAVVDGTVASKLQASLETQADGPPKLAARFQPEFRLQTPAAAPLPLGVDSLALGGLHFDVQAGGSVEDLVLRKGDQVVLSVKHVRPLTARLGVSAEQIAFALPETRRSDASKDDTKGKDDTKAKDVRGKDAKPKAVDDGGAAAPGGVAQAVGTRMWNGTAERLSVALDGVAGADIQTVTRLETLKVTLPGNVGIVGAQAIELRTDKLPGDQPLEALSGLRVEQPSLDLPWRQEALQQLPGGAHLWKAVTAAELAKLKREAIDEAEEMFDDPNLPPDVRAKKVDEQVQAKLKAAGKLPQVAAGKGPAKGAKRPTAQLDDDGKKAVAAAKKSWTATQIEPLQALYKQLLDADELVQRIIAKMSASPKLKLEVIQGRLGLVRDGATKPFGGMQEISLSVTPQQGDGTRGVLASAKPFDDERVWGEVSADVITAAGQRLDRARIKLSGGQFAQALRIVSSAVSVTQESDITVTLDVKTAQGAAKALTIEGDFAVKRVGFDWWRLAPKPIDAFSASGKMTLQASAADHLLRLDLPNLALGDARLNVTLEAADIDTKPTVHVRAELPKQDCAAVAKAIPSGMLTTIGQIEASGQIGWLVDLKVPLADVYKASLDLALDDADCQVTRFGDLDVGELARDFSRPVNENGVMLDNVPVGPSSGSWVPLGELNAWTWWSMVATEDGAFYKHRGLRPGLLTRAVRLDLDYGRFVYGGSTITQQLVKNIYLTRAKHLSRKFEELLIVWHMERELPKLIAAKGPKDPPNKAAKDRILELYINMIEFGNDGNEIKVYGIQRAAQTYFGKDASALSPLESAFLAANKPCPRCGYSRFVKQKWDDWWSARMAGIMEKMRREKIITDEQYRAEMPFVPKFVGWPAAVEESAIETPLGGAEE